MPAKKSSSWKTKIGNEKPEPDAKGTETIHVQRLKPHDAFDVRIIELAEDLAYHHVTCFGLSVNGSMLLSATMPCLALLSRRSVKERTVVIGGLASLFIARTVSLENSVFCRMCKRAPPPEQLVAEERQRFLLIAPLYCQVGPEGVALLNRIWQFCTPAERKNIYRVSSFKAFASRANIRMPRQAKAPFAKTRAYYEIGEQKQFPGF